MSLQVQCPQINYSCTLIFTSIRTTKTLGIGGTQCLMPRSCGVVYTVYTTSESEITFS